MNSGSGRVWHLPNSYSNLQITKVLWCNENRYKKGLAVASTLIQQLLNAVLTIQWYYPPMQIRRQININVVSSSTYTVIIINLCQQSKTVLVEADGYQRYKTQKKVVKSPSSNCKN